MRTLVLTKLTSKALEPEYKKAAQKLKGLAKLVAVDCDNQDNKGLCGQYGVQGILY